MATLLKLGLVCALLLFHLSPSLLFIMGYQESCERQLERVSPCETKAATVHVRYGLISKKDTKTSRTDIRGQVEDTGKTSDKR